MAFLPDIIRRKIKITLADAFDAARVGNRQLPTSTMYFAEPLADCIGTRLDGRERPIRKVSNTVFTCGDAVIVIRYMGPRLLPLLQERRFKWVYLVVDDDLYALHENDGLPADYRQRLIRYRDGVMQDLLDQVTHVVAPSERILARYRRKQAIKLDPAQCHMAGGLGHHRGGKGLDVVFAGTRSHLLDLGFVAEEIAAFLKAQPEARLTTFLNGHAPKALRNLPNALHLPMMGWNRYRAFVAQNRFHVAIAPALDTDFNQARSVSKVHEHAAFGAAGIYSRQPPFSDIVDDGRSGLLLPNEPQRWRNVLFELAGRRDTTEALAAEGQDLSRRLGDTLRVRNFWLEQLGLSPGQRQLDEGLITIR